MIALAPTRRADVRRRVDLVVALAAREVTLRYRRSTLGVLWSQLGPLVTLGVLTFLFTEVVPLDIPDYGAFVLTGLMAWTWFSGAVTTATASVAGSADLIRRPGFPVALLPLVGIGSHLIHYVLTLPVLVLAVVLSTGRLPVTVVALPLVILCQAALMAGPAWALAAWNVRFRDVSHLVSVALFPLFYATPVFYDASMVPDTARGLYRLNPLVHLIDAYRAVVLLGDWPSWSALAAVAAAGCGVAVCGRWAFDRMAPTFPDDA